MERRPVAAQVFKRGGRVIQTESDDLMEVGSRTRALPWNRTGMLDFLIEECTQRATRETDPEALRAFIVEVQARFPLKPKRVEDGIAS